MRKLTFALIIALALVTFALVGFVRQPGIAQVIQHYPTIYAETAGGCMLNYADEWVVYDTNGDVLIETKSERRAAQALALCDMLPVKP